ncbi:hypothetical protein VB773_04925 [Haloarculaceae archaeon H-GB2-1]|nr:hypothetical protein [Haloarculaceae archaeon H-GB1-1]MEA5388928.1 hypothetical protein [Haloarculaceae archaeon H-GB11]MEA5406984.1 hypothetical protein [Haloarculaceae archaeon H-GB2-1]
MGYTTAERIRELLEGVMADTDDDQSRFRLRTALQLIELIEERHDVANEVLEECDLDAQTRQNLQELGYLN